MTARLRAREPHTKANSVRSATLLAVLTLSVSCQPAATPTAELPSYGWVGDILDDPASFTAVIDGPERSAWIALHGNQIRDAQGIWQGQVEQLELENDLLKLATVGAQSLIAEWEESGRSSPPPSLQSYKLWVDSCEAASPPPHPKEGRIATVSFGEDARQWPDPCAMRKTVRAFKPLPQTSADRLEDRLFSVRHLSPEECGWPELGPSDDPESLREAVKQFDARLDAARADRTSTASADARALINSLSPFQALRSDLFVAESRNLLNAGRYRQAATLLRLAHDPGDRGLSVTNSASMYALSAQASLRSGRPREALDHLHPIREQSANVPTIRAIIEDLVVLQSMGREGDSKEQ